MSGEVWDYVAGVFRRLRGDSAGRAVTRPEGQYLVTPPTLADEEYHHMTLTSDGKLRVDDPTTQEKVDDIEDKLDDGITGLAAIKAEVEGLGGAAMRGTDNAALAAVCTEARLSKLDAAVSSRAVAPSAYYYTGVLANNATYVPAAGVTVQLAYIEVAVIAEYDWFLADSGTDVVDAFHQGIHRQNRTIQGPIFCDGARVGFSQFTGASTNIRLIGFS